MVLLFWEGYELYFIATIILGLEEAKIKRVEIEYWGHKVLKRSSIVDKGAWREDNFHLLDSSHLEGPSQAWKV